MKILTYDADYLFICEFVPWEDFGLTDGTFVCEISMYGARHMFDKKARDEQVETSNSSDNYLTVVYTRIEP